MELLFSMNELSTYDEWDQLLNLNIVNPTHQMMMVAFHTSNTNMIISTFTGFAKINRVTVQVKRQKWFCFRFRDKLYFESKFWTASNAFSSRFIYDFTWRLLSSKSRRRKLSFWTQSHKTTILIAIFTESISCCMCVNVLHTGIFISNRTKHNGDMCIMLCSLRYDGS